MASINSTARRLGRYMREMRERAGISTYAVEEEQVVRSRRTLGRAEKGEVLLSWPQWKKLGEMCGATEDELEHIEAMARKAGEKGWWEERRSGMAPKFQRYISLESEADRMCNFDAESVGGLFQTRAYMEALFRASPLVDAKQISRMIEIRLRRQREVLENKNAPSLRVLMPEEVLVRKVGGAAAHSEQCEHLFKLARRRNLEMRVLPLSLEAHPIMNPSFTIFEFDDPNDVDMVHVESPDGSRYPESKVTVDMYRKIFEAGYQQAVRIQEILT